MTEVGDQLDKWTRKEKVGNTFFLLIEIEKVEIDWAGEFKRR